MAVLIPTETQLRTSLALIQVSPRFSSSAFMKRTLSTATALYADRSMALYFDSSLTAFPMTTVYASSFSLP